MKVLELLVRNYYELHGNFNGIELTTVGESLRKESKKNGIDLIEFCYILLGYKPYCSEAYGEIPAKKVCELRALWLKTVPDTTENELAALMKEIIGTDKKPGISTFNTLEDKYKIYAKMLYHYYLYENRTPIKIGKDIFDFKTALGILRKKKVQLKKFRSCLKSGLVNPTIDDKDCYSDPCIINNTFYLKSFDAEEWERTHLLVLQSLLNGVSLDIENVTLSPEEYIFTSLRNPEVYLSLLDIANSRSTTYAKLVLEFGLNIADQIALYDLTGVTGITVGNTFHYIDGSKDKAGNFSIKVMPLETLIYALSTIQSDAQNSVNNISNSEMQMMEVFK